MSEGDPKKVSLSMTLSTSLRLERLQSLLGPNFQECFDTVLSTVVADMEQQYAQNLNGPGEDLAEVPHSVDDLNWAMGSGGIHMASNTFVNLQKN